MKPTLTLLLFLALALPAFAGVQPRANTNDLGALAASTTVTPPVPITPAETLSVSPTTMTVGDGGDFFTVTAQNNAIPYSVITPFFVSAGSIIGYPANGPSTATLEIKAPLTTGPITISDGTASTTIMVLAPTTAQYVALQASLATAQASLLSSQQILANMTADDASQRATVTSLTTQVNTLTGQVTALQATINAVKAALGN